MDTQIIDNRTKHRTKYGDLSIGQYFIADDNGLLFIVAEENQAINVTNGSIYNYELNDIVEYVNVDIIIK